MMCARAPVTMGGYLRLIFEYVINQYIVYVQFFLENDLVHFDLDTLRNGVHFTHRSSSAKCCDTIL